MSPNGAPARSIYKLQPRRRLSRFAPRLLQAHTKKGEKKFARFAENVWSISRNGKTDGELAVLGAEALADFIKEIGMPTTLGELGIDENVNLKEIANSCNISQGSYKKLTHDEILTIFEECK